MARRAAERFPLPNPVFFSGLPATDGPKGRRGPGPKQPKPPPKLPEGVEPPSVFEPCTTPPKRVRAVSIDRLAAQAGWAKDSWQVQFLRAADAAPKSGQGKGTRSDGQLTLEELRDYSYHPSGAKFLTSLSLEQVLKATGEERAIQSFPEAWMKDVAGRAAARAHRTDGKVSREQVLQYAQKLAAGQESNGATWVTNQRVQVLFHHLARFTQERDALDSPNKLGGTEMVFPAMALAFDTKNNIAITASNTYFAADEKLGTKTERSDKFFSAGLGVDPKVFSGPVVQNGRAFFQFNGAGGRGQETFDKGHLLANLNFVDPRDRATSFATENMHPQVPASNSGVWLRKVEMAVREEVVALDGRAVDVSGVLFADRNYQPLPADRIPWISGAEGAGQAAQFDPKARIPVPTHTWKAVLFQSGDTPPRYQARCYIVENRMDLDRSSEPTIVSLKEMERILGGKVRLFQDLPPQIRQAIESDPNQTVVSKDTFITRERVKLAGTMRPGDDMA